MIVQLLELNDCSGPSTAYWYAIPYCICPTPRHSSVTTYLKSTLTYRFHAYGLVARRGPYHNFFRSLARNPPWLHQSHRYIIFCRDFNFISMKTISYCRRHHIIAHRWRWASNTGLVPSLPPSGLEPATKPFHLSLTHPRLCPPHPQGTPSKNSEEEGRDAHRNAT